MANDLPVVMIASLQERKIGDNGRAGLIVISNPESERLGLAIRHDVLDAYIMELQTLRADMTTARSKAGLLGGPQNIQVRRVVKFDGQIEKLRGALMLRLHLEGGDVQTLGFDQAMVEGMIQFLSDRLEVMKKTQTKPPN